MTEKLDLSTATGRMFFNIIGTFAQFYREQLAENVRMGMQQAVREGKWINRPKTGYDLVDGELVPNDDAPAVRQIFRLRAEGVSHREISEQTGHQARNGDGDHSPPASTSERSSSMASGSPVGTSRSSPKPSSLLRTGVTRRGKRRGRDLLSGHVRCGVCARAMSIRRTGRATGMYRCAASR